MVVRITADAEYWIARSSPAMTGGEIFKQRKSFSRRDSPELCASLSRSRSQRRRESRMPAAPAASYEKVVEIVRASFTARLNRHPVFPATTARNAVRHRYLAHVRNVHETPSAGPVDFGFTLDNIRRQV